MWCSRTGVTSARPEILKAVLTCRNCEKYWSFGSTCCRLQDPYRVEVVIFADVSGNLLFMRPYRIVSHFKSDPVGPTVCHCLQLRSVAPDCAACEQLWTASYWDTVIVYFVIHWANISYLDNCKSESDVSETMRLSPRTCVQLLQWPFFIASVANDGGTVSETSDSYFVSKRLFALENFFAFRWWVKYINWNTKIILFSASWTFTDTGEHSLRSDMWPVRT